MQVSSECEAQLWQRKIAVVKDGGKKKKNTYFSTAVFQQDIDVVFVLEMVIKVHNVFMVQNSMELNFSVNLEGGGGGRQSGHYL